MGILDDAIREHLDLKRRLGAEDDELARLEDEAFGPPSRPGDPDFPDDNQQAAEPVTGEAAQPEAATEATAAPATEAPSEERAAAPPAPEPPSEEAAVEAPAEPVRRPRRRRPAPPSR